MFQQPRGRLCCPALFQDGWAFASGAPEEPQGSLLLALFTRPSPACRTTPGSPATSGRRASAVTNTQTSCRPVVWRNLTLGGGHGARRGTPARLVALAMAHGGGVRPGNLRPPPVTKIRRLPGELQQVERLLAPGRRRSGTTSTQLSRRVPPPMSPTRRHRCVSPRTGLRSHLVGGRPRGWQGTPRRLPAREWRLALSAPGRPALGGLRRGSVEAGVLPFLSGAVAPIGVRLS